MISQYDPRRFYKESFESAIASADRANAAAELSIKQHILSKKIEKVFRLSDRVNKRIESVLEGRYILLKG